MQINLLNTNHYLVLLIDLIWNENINSGDNYEMP